MSWPANEINGPATVHSRIGPKEVGLNVALEISDGEYSCKKVMPLHSFILRLHHMDSLVHHLCNNF